MLGKKQKKKILFRIALIENIKCLYTDWREKRRLRKVREKRLEGHMLKRKIKEDIY